MKNCNQRRNATRRDAAQRLHNPETHVWNGAKKRDQVGRNSQQEIRGPGGGGGG